MVAGVLLDSLHGTGDGDGDPDGVLLWFGLLPNDGLFLCFLLLGLPTLRVLEDAGGSCD